MALSSFDIYSKIDTMEVKNAIQNTLKEITNRFDFKGVRTNISLEDNKLSLTCADPGKIKALLDAFFSKLVKRGLPLKAFQPSDPEPSAGGGMRQLLEIQIGIPVEKAKEIQKFIKSRFKKIQTQIQNDTLRVFAKNKDELQDIITSVRAEDFGIHLDCGNYR